MGATQAIVAAELAITLAGRDPRECSYTAIMAIALELFKASNAVKVVSLNQAA